MGKKSLIPLNNIPKPVLKDGFGLDTLVLEQEMRANNGGIDLSHLKRSDLAKVTEEEYASFVPHFFGGDNPPDKKRILKITRKYPQITGPCSMSLNSLGELAEHMAMGYLVSHFHYILGKKHNLKGSFPYSCCGISSRSVMLSLMELGYPNATYGYSDAYDHGYTLLPFVFEKKDIKGTVVIDPTYDQLWSSTHERNAVFIKLGTKWEYRTDWHKRSNLFPDELCSIDTLRLTPEDICDDDYYHKGGEKYFRKAFSNPVQIKN